MPVKHSASFIVLCYVVAFPVMWFLTEVSWGAAGGISFGVTFFSEIMGDKDFLQSVQGETIHALRQHGYDVPNASADFEDWWRSKSDEERVAIKTLLQNELKPVMEPQIKKHFSQHDEFFFTFVVSAWIFGCMGFFIGLITESWRFVGILPAASFVINNPLIRFHVTTGLEPWKKIIIVLFAQLFACYILAYFGAQLNMYVRRNRVKRAST